MTLLLHDIAQTLDISNKLKKNTLSLNIKEKFLTNSLLQNAREKAKIDIFGLPHVNVQYATGLHAEMEAKGHKVLHIEQNARHVHLMLERIVLKEEIERQKRDKVNMIAQSKNTFLEKWREANAMF